MLLPISNVKDRYNSWFNNTAFSEKKFELETSKDLSSLYSIKIKNNEIWIKNIQENKINFIKFSNFDLKNMTAENIKIIEIDNNNKTFLRHKQHEQRQ